jgi:hypothetical protein
MKVNRRSVVSLEKIRKTAKNARPVTSITERLTFWVSLSKKNAPEKCKTKFLEKKILKNNFWWWLFQDKTTGKNAIECSDMCCIKVN